MMTVVRLGYCWQLPVVSVETISSAAYVHGSTKIHFFNFSTGESACKRYWQPVEMYDDIDDIDMKGVCKICWRKYQKIINVGGN